MNQNFVKKLYNLCERCLLDDEVPVSCLIVKNGNIISVGRNKKHKFYDPLGHAEIIAIKKACKKLKCSNLMECEMYVSLKPCKMCEEVIKSSKIKQVFYILDQEKPYNYEVSYKKVNLNEEIMFKSQIKCFFEKKR